MSPLSRKLISCIWWSELIKFKLIHIQNGHQTLTQPYVLSFNCVWQAPNGNEYRPKLITKPDPSHRRAVHAWKIRHFVCPSQVHRIKMVDRVHRNRIWMSIRHLMRRHPKISVWKKTIQRHRQIRQSKVWIWCVTRPAMETVRAADSCHIIKRHTLWAPCRRNDRQSMFYYGELALISFLKLGILILNHLLIAFV